MPPDKKKTGNASLHAAESKTEDAAGNVSLTAAEYAALKKAAAKTVSTDIEEIAKRPYQTIKDSAGNVLCYPPAEGGPLTLNGQHPDDFYAVDDKGVATEHTG